MNHGAARFFRLWGTALGLLGLCAVFALLAPEVFPSPENLRNVVEQAASLAIVAAGVTVVMAAGDFDLSCGAIAGLTGVMVALAIKGGVDPGAAVVLGLGFGAAAGCLNGLLVAYGGISAFVATLATMTAFNGLSLYVTKGTTLFGLPDSFAFLGQGSFGPLPASVLAMALALAAVYLLMDQSVYGRRLYAIGGNMEASYLSGIDTRLHRFVAFGVSGFFAALGGVVLTSRLASAHPQAGTPFMLNATAAVFLGMTAFREGEANLWGTFLGVLIMGVMGNGLNIVGMNSYLQSVLTGAIIVAAVLFSSLAKRRA